MRVHPSLRRLTTIAALTTSVLCFSPLASAQADKTEKTPEVNNSALNAPLLYELLVGEIELRSGKTATAQELLLDAARKSNNEAVFKRATNIALQMRDGPKTLAAVQAWRKALPKSIEASRYEVQVLMALQRSSELPLAIGHLITLSPAKERPGVIGSLPELLSTSADKKQTVGSLEPVLKPWLQDPSTRMASQLALARLLSADGQNERALELVQTAHTQNPKAQDPAAVALELLSSSPSAEPVIQSFLKNQPSAHAVRMAYARALSQQQRFPEAIEQLTSVTQRDPALAAPWLGLGALYLERKQPTETIRVVNIYLKRLADGAIRSPGPNASAALPDLEMEDASSEGNQGTQAYTTQAYFLLSKAAQQQRDWAAAEGWLDKITDPQRTMDVLLRRTGILAEQGKLEQAVEIVRRAPDTGADAQRSKINIEAQLYTNAKQWPAAEAVLAKANERFPNDADLLYQQAMMAEKLDRMDDMEKLLRRVIGIRPDHFHAYNALGYSLAERKLRLPEAKELITKALTIAPGEPFITDSLGWVEYRLGNLDEATRLLKTAYRLRPDVEIAVHLGEVLWVSGQRDEARRLLREARSKGADNEALRETISRLKVDI
jgi:tetratricopeptide (TPR) repeat protein